ncbi:Uncharacterised protein [Mycobacterium tuberculosis]|nr:Uncharacterised protein [Mycobacterium tuberculosis]
MPPAPPAPPLPGAASVPSPINGRPNSARVGALMALSSSSCKACRGEAAASAAMYEPAPAVKVCTNWS